MSIFQRLYNIARANLKRRVSGDDARHSDSSHWDPGRGSSENADGAGSYRETPPSQDPKLAQYYANLEIPYGSDLATVRKAWKDLLKKYHPDLHSIDPAKKKVAEELSQELNRAYQELANHLKQK